MNLVKLLRGFVKVVLCISCPLPNKTKLKFDEYFKAFLIFYFELKVLNYSEYSVPWVCPAFVIVYVGVFEWDELVPSPSLTRVIVKTQKSYTILKMISYNIFFSFQLYPNKQNAF